MYLQSICFFDGRVKTQKILVKLLDFFDLFRFDNKFRLKYLFAVLIIVSGVIICRIDLAALNELVNFRLYLIQNSRGVFWLLMLERSIQRILFRCQVFPELAEDIEIVVAQLANSVREEFSICKLELFCLNNMSRELL